MNLVKKPQPERESIYQTKKQTKLLKLNQKKNKNMELYIATDISAQELNLKK